jgi:uncharacterized lipoprotein YbaY
VISVVEGMDGQVLGRMKVATLDRLPFDYELDFDEQLIQQNPNRHFNLIVRLEVDDDSDYTAETLIPIFHLKGLEVIDVELAPNHY